MVINFNKTLLDHLGEPVEDRTVWGQVILGLGANRMGESPEDKQRAYELLVRVRSNPSAVELTLDEAAFLRDKVGWVLMPVEVGQINECLDGGA